MVLKIFQWFKLGDVTTDPISYSVVIHKYFRHLPLIFNYGSLYFQLDVCKVATEVLCRLDNFPPLECQYEGNVAKAKWQIILSTDIEL